MEQIEKDAILNLVPGPIAKGLADQDWDSLLELVFDLGYHPQCRYPDRIDYLDKLPKVDAATLEQIDTKISGFNKQNRAGLDQTLHRVSSLLSTQGRLLGVTVRVGRAMPGCLEEIDFLLQGSDSILFLGPPGMGKTTKLREAARILSTDYGHRVMIVDAGNEIAGMGDLPHKGLGLARRMQVADGSQQAQKMIEAVENHMPDVIIVDEIGTEEKAIAARSIAERGVRLIATAHGDSLPNLIKNPTVSDLVGGVQAVILGDDEARFRGCQKTILERKGLPTFQALVELRSVDDYRVYTDVKEAVDQYLRGEWEVAAQQQQVSLSVQSKKDIVKDENAPVMIYPFGINTKRLSAAIHSLSVDARITQSLSEAEIVLTTRTRIRNKSKFSQLMEHRDLPVHILKSDAEKSMREFLRRFFRLSETDDDLEDEVRNETMHLCQLVIDERRVLDASARSSYFRRIQHEIVEQHKLHSVSVGEEPNRRVRIFPG